VDEKGRPASGTIENGKFTLSTYREGDGAVPGKNKVAVVATEEQKTKDGDTTVKYTTIRYRAKTPGKTGTPQVVCLPRCTPIHKA
jgi:hypothetical protein